jgi:predicted glutamine amidotransferase
MCKLAGWTSSKENPLTKAAADAAITAAAKVIMTTERDGLGYAQSGNNGLRARFLDPKEYLGMDSIPNMYRRAGKAAGAFATTWRTAHEGSYNPSKHMMIHGRTATCGISLENVHPFRRKGWTLAHNGVVNWEGPKCKEHDKVTCDSQHLLIAMADHTPMLQRKEALEHISGYAAFLALNPQGKLVVAVDDRASLYAGITSKGRWIFGTRPTIVDAIADAWKAKGVTPYPIDNWTWLEFDQSGKDPELGEWKHKTANSRQLGFASQSLGSSWTNSHMRKKKEEANSHGLYSSNYQPYVSPAKTSREAWLTAEEAADQRDLMLEADEIQAMQNELIAEGGIPDWDRAI